MFKNNQEQDIPLVIVNWLPTFDSVSFRYCKTPLLSIMIKSSIAWIIFNEQKEWISFDERLEKYKLIHRDLKWKEIPWEIKEILHEKIKTNIRKDLDILELTPLFWLKSLTLW